jgi:rhodanese-related sulfurtransferase
MPLCVDLRQRDDFRKGHIAGPLTCCRAKSKRTTLASLKSTNQPIIVVDGSGMQAQESASALIKPVLKTYLY